MASDSLWNWLGRQIGHVKKAVKTDVTKPAAQRRFMLPNAHAHVLIDDDSEACMKPCAAVIP